MKGINYFCQSTDKYDYEEPERELIEVPMFTTRDLGSTIVDGKGQGTIINSVGAALRNGTTSIEFTPQASGEPGIGTESIGTESRKQVRDLLRLNDAKIHSIHVPPEKVGNVTGWSGEKGFNEAQLDFTKQEIKKHVDLAADLQGGAIVFHTNEFPRKTWKTFGHEKKQHGGGEFFPLLETGKTGEEDYREGIIFVDKKNGKVALNFDKNQKIEVIKNDGKSWVDKYSEALKDGKTDEMKYDVVPKIEKRDIFWYENESDKDKDKFKKKYKDVLNNYSKIFNMPEYEITEDRINPERAMLIDAFEPQFRASKANVERYDHELRQMIVRRDILKKQIPLYEEAEESAKNNPQLSESLKVEDQLNPEVKIWQSEELKRELSKLNGTISLHGDQVEQAIREAHNRFEQFNNLETVQEHGFNTATETLSELGYYAYKKTKEKMDSGQALERPIYMAPENIFPQGGYGSHLEEMKDLVLTSRKKLIEKLKGGGMNESKAAKIASHSIRSTLDTQHLGMWRAHFKPKKNESDEAYKKRFDRWYMDQVKRLAEADVIGNMHIVDGFNGHTHVAIGEGTLQVVNAVKAVKGLTKGPLSLNTEAYEDKVGNLSAQQMNMWRAFDAPMRSIDNADAGLKYIDSKNTWVTYGMERFTSRSTTFNTPKSINETEEYKSWDGLPLE